MKLAMGQMKNFGSMDKNFENSIRVIQKAAMQKADLVLFPEVQLTPFFPQYAGRNAKKYALTLEHEYIRKFQEACRVNKIIAVPNIYLLENEKYYDASLFIGKNGEIAGIQKMVHIAQAEQFYEQDYYEPSEDGFQVFGTEYGKIGIVVCFDRHYPESIRTETLMGADLILVPTVNVKTEPLEMFEWEIKVQAFQNSVAIAMCNRTGKEDAMDFAGESLLVDANGNTIVKADDREQIIYTDVDLSVSKKVRSKRPYTNLRRNELYL